MAYNFNKNYGGYEFDSDIYNGLYFGLRELNGEDYNAFAGHKDGVRGLKFGILRGGLPF